MLLAAVSTHFAAQLISRAARLISHDEYFKKPSPADDFKRISCSGLFYRMYSAFGLPHRKLIVGADVLAQQNSLPDWLNILPAAVSILPADGMVAPT